jgi:hypothetical protein
MEAVMEAVPERESARESGMRKPRSESAVRKTRPAEMTAAEMHPSSHAAEVCSTTEVTAAATEMPATAAVAAATTAASSERRWREGKRGSKRASSEEIKELVVHPGASLLNCCDG